MLKDSALVEKMIQVDEEFKALFENHIRFEQDLEALYSLKYFPPEVEAKMKELKVLKLRGKDKMEQLMVKYKSDNGL
ncbi:DUF465 domain-containing protein [Seleniivibrio woodruffii]|uniref:DUF465 domain-containing protein n=1 Tax=Seleniivibrio woodruffii TaxID=1078050 RepID=A0A4R1K9L2_9BACT|nr:DUF465 domain-containing protein [Seleniivibrio woodruffii]TCK60720.1 hypothetical protein C8D98_1599 [Seleniivibrio woodruffii]TVZ36350.1 hypothetical protein OF66_1975 [Seleniivibrio woodruffii]